MSLLLNIVDFDPKKPKKLTKVKDKDKVNRDHQNSKNGDEQLRKAEKKASKSKEKPEKAAQNNAKRKLSAASAATESPAPKKFRPEAPKGTAIRKKLSKTDEAAAGPASVAARAGNLEFKSVPAEQREKRQQLQTQQRHRQKTLTPAAGPEEPDWASVADCLQQEVKDVEKLFQEQLDMETRTAEMQNVFSGLAIKDCKDIHPYLVSLLTEKLGLEYFTKVQAETLPLVLAGKDVLIKTQTGSGKSLALLLPLVQQLQAVQPPLSRSSGTQALVLCPTHELAEQSHSLLQQLLRPFVRIVSGQLVGGVKRKSQKASLRRGLNILVATPRRLLDHLERSSRLHLGSGIRMLIIDEADRLAELGFERDVRRIVEAVCACGRRPQTLLCSATLTDGTERLAGLALSQPSCVSEEAALPASVQHFVLAAPTRMRLRALLSALRPALAAGHKAALFLPTQASVDFHHGLLSALLSDSVPLCRLHGNLAHADRIRAFREFASRGGSGLLVTTDVSARGLDLSRLSWVIQGPGEPQLYCHRAGRTARLGRPGRCLLLLDSAEVAPYLRLLTAPDSPGRGLRFAPVPAGRLMARCCPENFGQLTQLVADTEQLRALAEDAFVSTVRARATFAGDLRAALPMPHLGHLASSFCLADPPGVIAANARRRRHPEAAEAAAASAKTERRTSKVSAGRRVRTGGAAVDRLSEFASGI
ncbi:hypothetical protein BOX15_Mlig008441g1 [Macrostomum lignano]|uniref:ATP-dependent RNA helicase n=1 Tax=Macrostomum lignano TaxID=282301 RepID=A0A267F5G6_9PLAT|nr:hypothetical protein BOX15_Mlig008441g1 [Macrostomum lignano]